MLPSQEPQTPSPSPPGRTESPRGCWRQGAFIVDLGCSGGSGAGGSVAKWPRVQGPQGRGFQGTERPSSGANTEPRPVALLPTAGLGTRGRPGRQTLSEVAAGPVSSSCGTWRLSAGRSERLRACGGGGGAPSAGLGGDATAPGHAPHGSVDRRPGLPRHRLPGPPGPTGSALSFLSAARPVTLLVCDSGPTHSSYWMATM